MHRFVVLLSTFLCQAFFGGIFYGTPRMLVAILDTFHVTRAQAGLVPAMTMTLCFFAGVVSGTITHKYGARLTGAMGAAMIAVPFCISFFATSVTYLVVTIGVLAGTGLALLYISCSPVVCEHFKGRSQLLALTFMTIGSSVGGMTYSYIIGVMLDIYGIRGTCLIIGGITLNAVVLTIPWASKPSRNAGEATTFSVNNIEISGTQPGNASVAHYSTKDSFKYVMSNKSFTLFAFGNAIHKAALSNALIYIVDTVLDKYQQESLGSFAPFLFSLMGVGGRLMCGFFKQLPHYSTIDTPLLSTVFGVVGCLLIALVNSVVLTLIAWCLNGVAMGISVGSISITNATLLGKENLATGSGILMTIVGVLTTVGGPLNGYIRDITGTYRAVFLSTAALIALGGVFLFAAKLTRLDKYRRIT